MLWFMISLMLVVACVIGKYLVIAEIRRLEGIIRSKQQKLLDVSERVKVAQQRYVIAQKAEGLAARKVATLKYRLSSLEDQIASVEIMEMKAELDKQQEVGSVLERVVRKALSQVGVEDETQIRKVMGAISSLIDLEKQGSSDELIAAIRDKLIQMREKKLTEQQEQTPPSQEPSLLPGVPLQPPVPQEATPVVLI